MLNYRDAFSGCLDAILFAECDQSRADMDDDTSLESHGYDRTCFTPDALDEVRARLLPFLWANRRTLRELVARAGYTSERVGHDFYFTTAGHGVGFWDRGFGKVGDALTDACGSYEWSVWSDDSEQLNLS